MPLAEKDALYFLIFQIENLKNSLLKYFFFKRLTYEFQGGKMVQLGCSNMGLFLSLFEQPNYGKYVKVIICDTELCNADEIEISEEEETEDNSSTNLKINGISLIAFGFIAKLFF